MKKKQNIIDFKIKNSIIISFKRIEYTNIFLNSFMPEFEKIISNRNLLKIRQIDNKIQIIIRSLDIKAFRAIINSILQFTYVVDKLLELFN